MHSLAEILESRNIAVIGASRDPLKPGAMLLRLLKDTGFQGQVAGVNPEGGILNGIQLYRALDEIPFPGDGYQGPCSHASVCEQDKVGLSVYDKPERIFISSITLLRNQRAEPAEVP
ncbi:MAG TPA: CoA-binding protein [Desulfatiglandales bacterium]|nr:CoA-binding protein [Desulfatiglandales bacterium]